MKKVPKVTRLIETSNRSAGERLHGLRTSVREHGPWSIRLTEQGRGAAVPAWLKVPKSGAVDDEVLEIARWLKTLVRPVGVLACLDLRGQQVLAACRLAGLSVRDKVAVIGVHNDELLCELCAPRLSSVIPNGPRAGYEAAALLRRAMTGKPLRVVLHEIAPLGVASRQSTDVAAVGDVKIADVVRFMRERAASGANVSDVLRAVPMARTALERRFKAALGTTPHAHLRKLRMERVKELLVSTTLPVGEVAATTGFENPEYLSAMFRRECGLSPREFRARHGGKTDIRQASKVR